MVSLLLGLCVEAGISKPVPRKPRTSTGATQRKPRLPAQKQANPRGTPQRNFGSQVPPALAGILSGLPLEGESWTKARRDEFVAMFETVLDFCVPVVTDQPDMEHPQ